VIKSLKFFIFVDYLNDLDIRFSNSSSSEHLFCNSRKRYCVTFGGGNSKHGIGQGLFIQMRVTRTA